MKAFMISKPTEVICSLKYRVFFSSLSRSEVVEERISKTFKLAATIAGATVLENI
jgi:hypothetical protein